MNKKGAIGAGIIIALAVIVISALLYSYEEAGIDFSNTSVSNIHEIPEGLSMVTVDGKLKPYDTPAGATQSQNEPEFVLVPDKNYPELQGAIQVALYNVQDIPKNPEHVQIAGYYNPKNPDWYYPEQTQRTQQVIYVEKILQLEPIDLGNKYTTQELRDRYDQIQNDYQNAKDQFMADKIPKAEYMTNLKQLVQQELQLYDDVKNHTFARDEMTEYNFWHRGVMKFPTSIEREISSLS